MAIPFLNNINLDDNQLLNAKLHVTSSAPTAAAGQIYFDSTAGVTSAKYYDGAAWVSLIQHTYNNGTFINLTEAGTDATRTLTADLSATGTPDATVYLRGDNTWSPINTIPGTYTFDVAAEFGTDQTVNSGDTLEVQGVTYIATTIAAGPVLEISHNSTLRTDTTTTPAQLVYGGTFDAVTSVTTNSTGHVTAINVATYQLPASDDTTYALSAVDGPSNDADIVLTDSGAGTSLVTIQGVTNETTVDASGDTITVGLPDDVTITGELTVSGTGQSSFGGQVTIPTTPVASTDAASKAYVDASVAGGLVYQGGYDANLNSPDLTTSPNSIEKGWTYTVTADGTFFGEQLRVGDVLVAEVNSPSSLADWTTVQNNIDLASLTQVGIGNVNEATASALLGIDVAYSSGTASVGLDIKNLTDGSGSVDPGGASLAVFNQPDDTNYKISIEDIAPLIASSNTYATTITDTATITHNFNTRDVIIQLYDTVTYETVYADVDRISTTQATITFATTPANSIRVLVQR
jgi:hypothetical protein